MSQASHFDRWQAGDRYDGYMGRWSRKIAPQFVGWLGVAEGLDWLDVGCGTGALSAAILARCNPASLIAVDPSEGFIDFARQNSADPRAVFRAGDASALPLDNGSRDVIASALVLNFVPDKLKALREMMRVARPGGTVGFYVWDYPGGGLEFLRAFWQVAIALDDDAKELTEDRRFPFCTPNGLTALAREAGLDDVQCTALETATEFSGFEDYWDPFTLGTGPAPGYCSNLAPEARQRLKELIGERLPRNSDGSISLRARAWGVKGIAA